MNFDFDKAILKVTPAFNLLGTEIFSSKIKYFIELYKPASACIVSFSRNKDNLLMWSHYASKHKHISNTIDEKMKKFNNIQDEDKPTGYIYVLQSKSRDSRIKEIRNLYKIGYCETTVAERIKNAACEPTYLMAPVKIVAEFKTYNMNTQKFEDLLHKFLGQCQVSIDVFDKNGTRHTPREWFQVPLEVIEQTIKLIVTGEVVNHKTIEKQRRFSNCKTSKTYIVSV